MLLNKETKPIMNRWIIKEKLKIPCIDIGEL